MQRFPTRETRATGKAIKLRPLGPVADNRFRASRRGRQSGMTYIHLWIFAIVILAGWIGTAVAKRRMRKSLGRNVSETELTSLNAWMEIEEKQERERGYVKKY